MLPAAQAMKNTSNSLVLLGQTIRLGSPYETAVLLEHKQAAFAEQTKLMKNAAVHIALGIDQLSTNTKTLELATAQPHAVELPNF